MLFFAEISAVRAEQIDLLKAHIYGKFNTGVGYGIAVIDDIISVIAESGIILLL